MGKTCTYKQCYVWKQNLACSADGTYQRLNGCCAHTDCKASACGYKTGCKNYFYKLKNVHDEQYTYCKHYNAKYKMEYTSNKGDYQADGKLQVNKVYVYTACGGGSGGSGGSGGTTGTGAKGTTATTGTNADGASQVSMLGVVFAAVMMAANQ